MNINLPATPSPHLAQQTWEFLALQRFVEGSKSFLEVGSRHGETLIRFAMTLGEGSRIVSVDNNSENTLGHLYFNGLFLKRYDVHLITGDSHEEKIISQVKDLGPYDFCFIDGDHSEEGVTKDYENYLPICKVVAFHDILLEGVKDFWAKHRRDYPMMEIIHPVCTNAMGIGILFKEVHL